MKNRPRQGVNFKSIFFFFFISRRTSLAACSGTLKSRTWKKSITFCCLYLEEGVYNFSGNFRLGTRRFRFPFCMKQPENVIPHIPAGNQHRVTKSNHSFLMKFTSRWTGTRSVWAHFNDYTLACISQTLGVPPYKCDNESQVVTMKRRHKVKYSPWFETYTNNPEELS